MKLMRLAMCLAIFAVVGGKAMSEEYIDISALQAKLAAQEARLNDLQAKMGSSKDDGGTAKNITSLRKNAKVTIGGEVDTRYYFNNGKVKSMLALGTNTPASNKRATVADTKTGDFYMDTAKLRVKIDVNENFDALLRMDLQDTHRRDVSGIAQFYWFRWKNVCNTGFGVLIGRDNLKYGMNSIGGKAGIIDVWSQDDAAGPFTTNRGFATAATSYGDGMFAGADSGNMRPAMLGWGQSRTTQINPYWESQDGRIKAEISLFQSLARRSGNISYGRATNTRSTNYGLGSGTARLIVKPIEGLTVFGSVANLYANKKGGHYYDGRTPGNAGYLAWAGQATPGVNNTGEWATNWTSVNGGFVYNPCFFNKATVWVDVQHDWNANWVKDLDIFDINYGVKFALTDKFTWFGQGEFMKAKNANSAMWHKGTGWSVYTGLRYELPYGVWAEAGWKHDQMVYKDKATGTKHTKVNADRIYGAIGFNF